MKPISSIPDTTARARALSADGSSLTGAISDAAAERHIQARNLRLAAERFRGGVGAGAVIDESKLLAAAGVPLTRIPGTLAAIHRNAGSVEACATEIASRILRGEASDTAVEDTVQMLLGQVAAAKAPAVPSIAPLAAVPMRDFPGEPPVRVRETHVGGIIVRTQTRRPA
jgi:hypothetical protein